jgi:DNA/RNA-binding domain of Phe-tRNA-synthetase-like protein
VAQPYQSSVAVVVTLGTLTSGAVQGPPLFRYADELIARFPTIRAGVVLVSGARNGPPDAALRGEFEAVQRAVASMLAPTASLADLPSLGAWRRVFSGFGVSPTKYRNAAEALLRRLQKQGEIPSVSTLVDVGNLVSIRHAVPVAVIDADQVAGPVTVCTATGDERFDDLGGTDGAHPEPGEVAFVDADGVVAARRWCWRQSHASAVGPGTTRALIVAEAHHDGAEADVAAAVASFVELFAAHLPAATVQTALLGPTRPAFAP